MAIKIPRESGNKSGTIWRRKIYFIVKSRVDILIISIIRARVCGVALMCVYTYKQRLHTFANNACDNSFLYVCMYADAIFLERPYVEGKNSSDVSKAKANNAPKSGEKLRDELDRTRVPLINEAKISSMAGINPKFEERIFIV